MSLAKALLANDALCGSVISITLDLPENTDFIMVDIYTVENIYNDA